MITVRKHLATFGLLLTLAVGLSGCIQVDRTVKLQSDGSGTYAATLGLSSQVLALGGANAKQQIDDSVKQDAKKNGATVRQYDANGFSYWEVSQSFKNVTALNKLLTQDPTSAAGSSSPVPTSGTAKEAFKVTQENGFLSSTFHVTGNLDFSADTSAIGTPTGIDPQQLLADAKETFTVTMPGYVSSHKGGQQNGNTVTYTVKFGEKATIDVVGGAYTTGAIVGASLGGLAVLGLIAAGVVIFLRRRRVTATPPPTMPAAYPPTPTY